MALPTLTELVGAHGFIANDLDTTGYVALISTFQKVYFADSAKYWKLDMVGTRITSSVNPTALGTPWAQGDLCAQAGGGTGVFDEVYTHNSTYEIFVYRTNTTQFAVGTDITVAGKTTLEHAYISAVNVPPYWLPWVEKTGYEGLISDANNSGSDIGCLYSGRIVLNSVKSPHQWYMSRQGDPLDWLVDQDDVGTAISSQSSQYGKIGDIVTALISYLDHYLIFGCSGEIWVMRGDPSAGGQLTNLSSSVGVFSPQSWCWDDKGNLYFMALDGLYVLPAGAVVNNTPPENLTDDRIPKAIKDMGLNRRTDRVILGYDKKRQGIVITAVQADGAWSANMWFDLGTKGLFPEEYNAEGIPASMFRYNNRKAGVRHLLVGGQDGYIRKFDEGTKGDETTASTEETQVLDTIESHVTLAPISVSEEPRGQSKLKEISIQTGTDTDSLSYELHTAETAQELLENIEASATPLKEDDLSGDGRYASIRDKAGGAVIGLKLKNTAASESWNLEKVNIKISKKGRIK